MKKTRKNEELSKVNVLNITSGYIYHDWAWALLTPYQVVKNPLTNHLRLSNAWVATSFGGVAKALLQRIPGGKDPPSANFIKYFGCIVWLLLLLLLLLLLSLLLLLLLLPPTIRMHTFCVKNWRLIHLCCFNRGPCRVACMHWIGIGPNYPPVILMLLDH